MYSPHSQLLFHALGVQDIPQSSWLLICDMMYNMTYKIALLHIFEGMFEIVKMCSFLEFIYCQGVKDQVTGHSYLQICYIFL